MEKKQDKQAEADVPQFSAQIFTAYLTNGVFVTRTADNGGGFIQLDAIIAEAKTQGGEVIPLGMTYDDSPGHKTVVCSVHILIPQTAPVYRHFVKPTLAETGKVAEPTADSHRGQEIAHKLNPLKPGVA